MKFGRLAPKTVALDDFTHYFIDPLPEPPADVQAPQLNWPMAGNDQYGDCTIAAVVHTDQATAFLTHEEWEYPGDSVVVEEYLELTGGPDTGLVETNVLQVWMNQGLFGCKLEGFAPIAPKHTQVIKQGVALCGAVYTGILVPAPAMTQFQNGQPWHVTNTPEDSDIKGGHAVPAVGYNAQGPLFVTWGKLQQATWEWWLKYGEEAYAVITHELVEANGLNGLDLGRLEDDLKRLA